jgi:nucleoside-diphosphate-sugar epimerase
MVVAVTGIDGFLGNYLYKQLVEEGINVLPISRKFGHDLRNIESLSSIPAFDTVIHLAAISFVPDSYKYPHNFYETNVTGTLNVLELARENKAKVIYVSSYVYGEPEYQPIDEKHPVKPFNPYAQSKVMAEDLCLAYNRDFKIPCTILRPFNIYGNGQAPHFLIPKLISHYLYDEEVTVFDPRPRRDYLHAADVAKALSKAISIESDAASIINLGYGKSHSIPEICNILENLTGRQLNIKVLNQYRPAEILNTVCNNNLAKAKLNWVPSITLEEGLSLMLEQHG